MLEAAVGEELRCEKEPRNRQNPFALTVVRSGVWSHSEEDIIYVFYVSLKEWCNQVPSV